jgi:hypothetical protein
MVNTVITRVVYHGVTSSFFGIGILPVSDLTGRSVFRSVLLVWRELLFSAKWGLAVSKRGPVLPFFLKKGANAPFLREKGFPPKKIYQNVPTKISFGIGMVNTKKIPTGEE